MLESIELRLAAHRVHGGFFRDPERDGHVTVVVIAGSGGGDALSGALARALAREGYAALGLGYFKVPGRPDELRDIDLGYVVDGVRVARSLATDPKSAVVLLGSSRGSEAAQLVAAHEPDLVQGVVALVPANECFGSWPPGGAAWTIDAAAAPLGPIPVERIKAPMFLVSAGSDEIWPSSAMAREIVARRLAHGRTTVHLDYPDATHALSFIAPTEEGTPADASA